MITPGKRFQLVPPLNQMMWQQPHLGNYSLMIEDYMWWADNERDILNWMADNLPSGIDHQQGMILFFPTDYDRINFLMRWGP